MPEAALREAQLSLKEYAPAASAAWWDRDQQKIN